MNTLPAAVTSAQHGALLAQARNALGDALATLGSAVAMLDEVAADSAWASDHAQQLHEFFAGLVSRGTKERAFLALQSGGV